MKRKRKGSEPPGGDPPGHQASEPPDHLSTRVIPPGLRTTTGGKRMRALVRIGQDSIEQMVEEGLIRQIKLAMQTQPEAVY